MKIASSISVMFHIQLRSFGFSVNPQRSAMPSDTASKIKESDNFNNTESVKIPHPSCLSLKV